ncbi:ArsR/SmtB family transcription factor [Pseudarthrobacter sp. J1763]|uniref:ArsR/SmtB family transcription factor n=1 Tax=Pseudarthrobacter sp. J1763 TaxID=3420445 RepID=UPI003D2BAAAB
MKDIEVIDNPAVAEASLGAIRTRILQALVQPASATMLAGTLELPRQKINYHLKALESVGLVELVQERRKGNVTERIVQASAASYVISPDALAAISPDPHRFSDKFSAFWLLALAARMVTELGKLITGAAAAKQPLATFAIDADLSFSSAKDRAAFAEELGVTVTKLVDKYHDGGRTPIARPHRLVVALHPTLKPTRHQVETTSKTTKEQM